MQLSFYSTVAAAGVSQVVPAHDISAVNMRAALMNLGGSARNIVGDIAVTRTPINTDKGFSWTVTFKDQAKNVGNIPELVLEPSALLKTACPNCKYNVYQSIAGQRAAQPQITGSREVQKITTGDATSIASGWWRAKFMGSEYTPYLPHDVSATDLKNALEGLTSMGKLTVTRDPFIAGKGYAWLVTFETNVGDQPAIMLDVTKLSPASLVTSTQPMTVYDGDNKDGHSGSYALGTLTCGGLLGCEPVCKTCVVGEQPVEYGSFETADANALTYQIPSLVPGTAYHVAVTAKNARGYGERQFSAPSLITPPQQRPGKPTAVAVDVQYGDYQRLKVSYAPPLSDGGDSITKYRVEWDTSISFPNPGKEEFVCPNSHKRAVWTISTEATGAPITGGYFNLIVTRNGLQYTTDPMPFSAVASRSDEIGGSASGSRVTCDTGMCTASHVQQSGSVEAKLEALPVLNDVTVSRTNTGNGKNGYTWTITFNDDGDDFAIAADTASPTLTGGAAISAQKVTSQKHVSAACAGLASCGLATSTCAGCAYTSCTGTRAIATTGGLTKGQLYYVRVFAYNAGGYSDPQISAAPQKPMVIPSAPTGATLQVLSAYQLKVIFSPPDDNGGDTITKYLVEWSTDMNFATSSSAVVSALTGQAPFFHTIGSNTNKLTMGTFYYVRVKAANSQGYGPTVRTSPNKLNPSKAPDPPTNVFLGSTSPSMLSVTFAPPSSDGGDTVTKYEIEWDKSPTFNSLEMAPHKGKVQVAATERAYTIQLLTVSTVYYVKVSAVNARGVGTAQKATPQFSKPELQVPGVPVSVTATQPIIAAPKTIVVSWQRPRIPHHGYPCFGTVANPTNCPTYVGGSDPQSDGGAAISKYKIQFSAQATFPVASTLEKEVTNAATSTELTTLDGVQSLVKYYVRVMAYNSRGFSSPCAIQGTICAAGGAAVETTTT